MVRSPFWYFLWQELHIGICFLFIRDIILVRKSCLIAFVEYLTLLTRCFSMLVVDLIIVQAFAKASLVIIVTWANFSSLLKGLSYAIGVVRNFFGLDKGTFGNDASILPLPSLISKFLPNFAKVLLALPSFNLDARVCTQEYLRM